MKTSPSQKSFRIVIIGSGVSGIAAANVLQQCGHSVVVYERSSQIGGVWAQSYPLVRLQNIADQYRMMGLPWPFEADLHPTAEQIKRYLQHVVSQQQIEVLTDHEVVSMEECATDCWLLNVKHEGETSLEVCDKVVVAVGQYTQGKMRPTFAGEDNFQGEIINEHDILSFEELKDQRVVVVGFGKSALDMAAMTAEHGGLVSHLFRQPRWLIPKYILGLHYTKLLFARQSTIMMPAWTHPTPSSRFLHRSLPFVVQGFWQLIRFIFTRVIVSHGRGLGKVGQARLKKVLPTHPFLPDLRSAVALAPDDYYQHIADGGIEPYHAELTGFTADGVTLSDGREIPADVVVLSLGSKSPVFPFFPEKYRRLLESEDDGVQLYRHLIHPRIPNIAFAGFNHGFMHIPAAEIGMMWADAYFSGRMQLPSVGEMEASIEAIRTWKRANIQFEPSRSCAINTRFQQYLDVLLGELKLSPYRKMPNFLAEVFAPYMADDYDGVLGEYLALPDDTCFVTCELDT